jgi:pyruvate/2-oxoacid:ferredoxin oxidoreductase beta subunit
MHAPLPRPRSLAALFAVAVSLALAPALAPPASAAPRHPPAAAPKELGAFGSWIAATHGVGRDKLCYAFTRTDGQNAATGTGPVLSITDRATGRDQVAISDGPLYPKGVGAMVQVGTTALDFYTSGHDAFARDGHAAATAFERGATAVLHPPGKGARPLTFSLTGFTAAHAAIAKACPAR